MHTFEELSKEFQKRFQKQHFPTHPESLYEPADYFIRIGGKRIRPVMCLMGNELFGEIKDDAWDAANAIELFHNFTLIHDDIMDKAPLRRGMQTVHEKFGEPVALLAGDVMLVIAYEYLSNIDVTYIRKIVRLFNATAKQVCEGQQIDVDFERRETVSFQDYLEMIELKTSVLLAASLRMGAILGGAGDGNQDHLYRFGKNLGLAFQIQDDLLDAFGDPRKFGKQVGGDILMNKKTFLLIRAREVSSGQQKKEINELTNSNSPDKIERMISIYRHCGVEDWAKSLKAEFVDKAFRHLEEIAVLSSRKNSLRHLAEFLVNREI
ncbi:MAG TPA: polyprenyl synthetase family protein [Puia sp.]|nr:polyprenyl synthetase family protein [Puia sp.]